MRNDLGSIIWQQFGAAIDMLNNAMNACPNELWTESVWEDLDTPEYGQFWFVVYHTLYWTDLYLFGSREGFAPPAPFVAGALPDKPYTKAALQTYLDACRQKCQSMLEGMSEEKANQRSSFPWLKDVSFAELQIYSMRHVQEHAAQLNLLLGSKIQPAPDWVARAEKREM